MFDNNIKTESIPERVFELCKMVSKSDVEDAVARERIEPKELNSSATSYYPIIREVCINELRLIEKENEKLKFVGDKKLLKIHFVCIAIQLYSIIKIPFFIKL